MNKIIYQLILVLVASYSCSSSEKSDSCELVHSSTKEFIIDDNTYYFSKCISAFVDKHTEKEYFSFENIEKGQSEILLYDMESGELTKRIPIHQEGANAVHGLFGHYAIDSNNFYLTSVSSQVIYHVNGEGDVLNKYEYPTTEENEPLSLYYFSSFLHCPTIIRDSLFYIPQRMFYEEMGGDDWLNTPICAVMNLTDRTVKNLPLSYPVLFKKRSLIDSTIDVGYSCDFDGNNFIYSFMKSDSLIVTSDHVNAKRYSAKSKYVNNVKIIPNQGNDILRGERELCKQGMYWHFLYDKYRDVYYRFVLFPCELTPKDDPMQLEEIRQEFSVMIMNKSFEVIGETKFPKNKYLPKMFFVGKEGLYISENNPYSEDFDENKLVFSCFTLLYN